MLGKSLSLHFCCTGLKRPPASSCSPAPQQMPNPMHAPSSSSSSSSPSPSSFKEEVFKNFNSLYDPTSDSETPTLSASQTLTVSFSSSDSSEDPDLAAAVASRRFFLASPGRSNSIVDSACGAAAAVGFGVAVPTYSPDPYGDFRRSMEEMVAALGLGGRREDDRVRLHELLLCYLALNRRHAHKYIVGAFADLLRELEEGGAAAAEA